MNKPLEVFKEESIESAVFETVHNAEQIGFSCKSVVLMKSWKSKDSDKVSHQKIVLNQNEVEKAIKTLQQAISFIGKERKNDSEEN